jgi:hypothetical protein
LKLEEEVGDEGWRWDGGGMEVVVPAVGIVAAASPSGKGSVAERINS